MWNVGSRSSARMTARKARATAGSSFGRPRGRESMSFWLQTETDKFYPDFVAELVAGTILVIEYKGESYRSNDDSKEKDELGRLWAARSGGRAKFLMAVAHDAMGRGVTEQIDAAIREGSTMVGFGQR